MRVAGLINSEEGVRVLMLAAKVFIVGQRARALGKRALVLGRHAKKMNTILFGDSERIKRAEEIRRKNETDKKKDK